MWRVEHPLIGINGQWIEDGEPRVSLEHRYSRAVLQAGGIAVVLPPVGGPADIRRMLSAVDAVLFAGGGDFDTERLGIGPTHPQARPVHTAKQDFDFALARLTLDLGIPCLGICYGMQLLALADGGRLFQHLPEDRPDAGEHRHGAVHAVALEAGSKLRRIVGVDRLDVVSRHHQAVAEVAGDWAVAARDDEGLIEAIELRRHPFALGVQWHPELAPQGSAHDRLFRGLVGAAGVFAGRREFGSRAPASV